MQKIQEDLTSAIRQFVHDSPLNRLKDIDGSPIWEEPLVGFASGDDPLFAQYKTLIGAFHLTPREVLRAAHGAAADAPQVSVVSWILPAAAPTRESNYPMQAGPSLRWNHTRFQGEAFNEELRRFVVGYLERAGIPAVAPVLSGQFQQLRTPDHSWVSTWSERHIAYAAGLGTFGLSDGLITARGIAHRCGSVVAAAHWDPSPRPYQHYQEYCSRCLECADRCPAGAIGPQGHDKDKCREYLTVNLAEWVKRPGFIGSYGACGLCQTAVSCEFAIP
jgi:epoxyqueuosine reductase